MGSIPESGRSPEEGNGNPLQCSCLENSKETEEPGRLQSTGSQWVRYDWVTELNSNQMPHVGFVWVVTQMNQLWGKKKKKKPQIAFHHLWWDIFPPGTHLSESNPAGFLPKMHGVNHIVSKLQTNPNCGTVLQNNQAEFFKQAMTKAEEPSARKEMKIRRCSVESWPRQRAEEGGNWPNSSKSRG